MRGWTIAAAVASWLCAPGSANASNPAGEGVTFAKTRWHLGTELRGTELRANPTPRPGLTLRLLEKDQRLVLPPPDPQAAGLPELTKPVAFFEIGRTKKAEILVAAFGTGGQDCPGPRCTPQSTGGVFVEVRFRRFAFGIGPWFGELQLPANSQSGDSRVSRPVGLMFGFRF